MGGGDVLYLNHGDLDSLGLTMPEIVDILEEAFRHKAAGATLMPPKIFFHRAKSRFFSAMASSMPEMGYGGCKWQSGDPDNPARGLPYIQGLYILSDEETGRPVAVMDSTWITGHRTAAASALVARYQARPGSEVLSVLGCGLQGRKNLEVLNAVVPSLRRCQAYDIVPERTAAYVEEMSQRLDIEIVAMRSAQESVQGADIVISAGPITQSLQPVIRSDWLAVGCLGVTLDYDSYWTPESIAAMDIVMTDDRGQVEQMQQKGRFQGIKRIDADIGELVTQGLGSRKSEQDRILSFNLGIAIEDLATAAELHRRAREKGIGTSLSL